jgi:hypothetical protein
MVQPGSFAGLVNHHIELLNLVLFLISYNFGFGFAGLVNQHIELLNLVLLS